MRPEGAEWRGLAVRLGIGAAAATALVVVGRLAALAFAPVPTVLFGLLIGAATWVWAQFDDPPAGPDWDQPQPPAEPSRFSADVRTRRLASMLVHAQPGQGFDSGSLARTLADLTTARLVRTRRLPTDDTLAYAEGHLSPALLSYLRAADGERVPVLSRRTLHAHLKEIDEL